MHKLVCPELELRILDKLNEGHQQAPRMRPIHNQPLQQNPYLNKPTFSNLQQNTNETNSQSYLVICSWIASVFASENKFNKAQPK